MTVRELIEELQKQDPDKPVYFDDAEWGLRAIATVEQGVDRERWKQKGPPPIGYGWEVHEAPMMNPNWTYWTRDIPCVVVG